MDGTGLQPAEEQSVEVQAGTTSLEGSLVVTGRAPGLVMFAHGSGSSRHSPRNRFVAHALQQAGLATLLLDLLTADEEAEDQETAHLRFDIDLLAQRLIGATDWIGRNSTLAELPLGYFGASTGAAAALMAAAERPEAVDAVVSRGGRPDLAGSALQRVQAPTLLIVGARDRAVLDLNRQAAGQLRCPHQIEVIPGASHLFEEPGALEWVALLAAKWFVHQLSGAVYPQASGRD